MLFDKAEDERKDIDIQLIVRHADDMLVKGGIRLQ